MRTKPYTSHHDVGAEAAFTYDDATDILTVVNASTTALSAYSAAFGATATTSIDTAGNVTFGGNIVIGGDTINEFAGTGLTVSGNALTTTLGTSVDLTSEVTGTLPVANGGTGATSFTSSQLLYGAGVGALQSVATTSATIGSSLSYSGTFGDLVGGSAGTLSLNTGNANSWTALQSFTNASSSLLSGLQAWFGSTATTSIDAGGDLTVGGGDIVLGSQSIFSGGDTASLNNIDALDATTESTIEAAIDTLANLTSAASLATVGTITSGVWNGTDIAVTAGGTGWGEIQANAILLGNGTGALATTSAGTNGQVLSLASGVPSWVATTTFSGGLTYSGGNVTADLGTSVDLAAEVTGTLPVANGGTGATTFTNNRLLTGNGTSALVDEANLTFDGSLLTITGNASTTQLGSSGSSYFATAGGNVGIGSTTPWAKLAVNPVAGDTNQFVVGSSTATSFLINSAGNIALGNNTSPTQGKVVIQQDEDDSSDDGLTIRGASADTLRVWWDETNNIGRFDGGSSGNSPLVLNGGGAGNVGVGTTTPLGKLHVYSAGSGASGLNSAADEFTIENSADAGLTILSPSSNSGSIYFGDEGSSSVGRIVYDHSANDLSLWTASTERLTITSGGLVGIGTTSPVALLSLSSGASTPTRFVLGRGSAEQASTTAKTGIDEGRFEFFRDTSAGSNRRYLDIIAGGTGGSASSTIRFFTNAGTGVPREAVRINEDKTLIIDGGTGKITVGTIDPVYTIDGVAYATYVAGMIGQKEETTGSVAVTTEVTDANGNSGYMHVIDFDEQEQGSDLWLFAQATQLNKNIDKLVALLTPQGNAKVWYEIHKTENQIILLSDIPTNVSYRFTAPRFDYEKWTNYNNDGVPGHQPPGTDEQFFNDPAPVISFGENNAIASIINAVLNKLSELGVAFVNGVVNITKLTVGSSSQASGITLYDEVTGAPYCLKIRNGAAVSFAGECGNESGEPIVGGGVSASGETDTAPVVEVFGNNPAEINIGDTYADLGASFTDDHDDNLGIDTFVDGVEVETVTLDTSEARTYTITYRVTDTAGNVGEATRTVVVGSNESEQVEEPVVEEEESINEESEPEETPEEVVVEENTPEELEETQEDPQS